MHNDRGFILLYRSTLENPVICKDSDYVAVWVHLLLTATHVDYEIDHKNERKTIKRGQLIASRKSIAEKYNIQESKVERILKRFETEQQIEQQGFNKYRIITLLNYDTYQSREQQNKQPVNNKRTTSEQQVNTYKEHKEHNQQEEQKKEDNIGQPDPIPYNEIIDYLNAKTDKNFKSSSKKNKDLIKARFNDGFDLNDFKKVIDIKSREWKDDTKMEQYLRPETLFSNKFEGYLNQKENHHTKPQDIKEWQRHQKGGPGHYI